MGDGPGEFRTPGSLSIMSDTMIGIASKAYGQFKILNQETGDPESSFSIRNSSDAILQMGRFRAFPQESEEDYFSFVGVVTEITGGGSWNWRKTLSRFIIYQDFGTLVPEGSYRIVGEASGTDIEEEDYYTLWDPWTIDALGRVLLAPYWNKYQLEYYSPDGQLLNTVEFPFEHRQRTKEERARLLSYGWGGTSPEQYGVDLVFSETEPAVRWLHPRLNGDVWVETSRSSYQGEGVFRAFDVISPGGELKFKAKLLGPGDDLVDRVYFCPDDRVVIIHGAERYIQSEYGRNPESTDYLLEIVCYKMVKVESEYYK